MANGIIDFLRGSNTTWHPVNKHNTTTPVYWLNLRAFLCYMLIITLMAMSLYFIRKYEGPNNRRSRNEEEDDDDDFGGMLSEDEVWKPCLKQIHPAWLMAYRIFAFFVLLFVIILNAISNRAQIFYYYTEWTFTLLIIYFGVRSLLSMYGSYHYRIRPKDRMHPRQVAGLCGCIFHIIFQMVAGAVVLTDSVF